MAGDRKAIICALSPSNCVVIEDQEELVIEPALNLMFYDEDSHAADDGRMTGQVILDKQRARELFNYLGAWLHKV